MVQFQYVADGCVKLSKFQSLFVCDRHVQVSNAGAIDFYKKFGFDIVDTKENYYKHITPADAFVLQRTLQRRS